MKFLHARILCCEADISEKLEVFGKQRTRWEKVGHPSASPQISSRGSLILPKRKQA